MRLSEEFKKDPKILIPEIKIQNRVEELAQEINQDYVDRQIVAVCVLKGSFVFFSDVIRHLKPRMVCEFLGLSHYEKIIGRNLHREESSAVHSAGIFQNNDHSSGEVKVTLDINEPLENKHVIIFDDIVDTGFSLSYIINLLKARKPASLRVCALLMKSDSLKVQVDVDYLGFKVGSEFIVGYGIDFEGKYRGLPYIGYIEHDH